MTRTYELTETEAHLAHVQVKSHCTALKNWIASAVECGDLNKAQQLVGELRIHEKLFAKLNVTAHQFIDKELS